MSKDDIIKNLSEFEVLFLTIYGEGRGEPIEGQVAIGNVIRNRLNRARIAATYKTICLQENQFSCWNSNDANFPLLIELGQSLLLGTPIRDITLQQCICVARGIRDLEILDNTHGAQNYLTTKLFMSNKKPEWASNPKEVKSIGNHSFLLV